MPKKCPLPLLMAAHTIVLRWRNTIFLYLGVIVIVKPLAFVCPKLARCKDTCNQRGATCKYCYHGNMTGYKPTLNNGCDLFLENLTKILACERERERERERSSVIWSFTIFNIFANMFSFKFRLLLVGQLHIFSTSILSHVMKF